MEKKIVSVIIPVYNGEETIYHCLDSALRQTYGNYEVIVVDNNSTDSTKKIIGEFQEKYKNLFYIFEAARSVGMARNIGVKNSKGEILCFTDCDCILPLNWIENLTKPIILGTEKIVMGSEENLVKNYWTNKVQESDIAFYNKVLKNNYIEHIDGKNFAIKSNVMIRAMFDPNIKMIDDVDLYIRLRKFSKVRFLPEVKVGHYHKSSMEKLIKMVFIRGFWSFNIYKKYNKEERKNIEMFRSLSPGNIAIFPLWLIKQIFTKKPKDSFYTTISELSWKAGIIWAIIKGVKVSSKKNING